jgi:Polyketide cyclase / dehydrase and lipid transport
MSDVERWHEWTASITSVHRMDAGPLAVGSRATVHQPKLPPAKWQVTELDPQKGFVWISTGPGVHVTGRHIIERTSSGSRITLAVEYRGALGAVLAWMTGSLNDRYIALEAAGLKRRGEDSGFKPNA